MHSLTELKKAFFKNGLEIHSFNGMYLETSIGRWSMRSDEYYLDGVHVPRKELKQLITQKILVRDIK